MQRGFLDSKKAKQAARRASRREGAVSAGAEIPAVGARSPSTGASAGASSSQPNTGAAGRGFFAATPELPLDTGFDCSLFRLFYERDLPEEWKYVSEEWWRDAALQLSVGRERISPRVLLVFPDHPLSWEYVRWFQGLPNSETRGTLGPMVQNVGDFARGTGETVEDALGIFITSMLRGGRPATLGRVPLLI
jgi:hypothetical protein